MNNMLRLTKIPNGNVEGSDPRWDGPLVKRKIAEIEKIKITLTRTEFPYVAIGAFEKAVRERGWIVVQIEKRPRGDFGKANSPREMRHVYVLKDPERVNELFINPGKNPSYYFKN